MQLYQERRLQVRQNALIGYTYVEYPQKTNNELNGWRWRANQNLKKEKYTGKLTEGAKKRLTKAIELLCQSIKTRWIENQVTGKRVRHRLSFITLTISQEKNITAREAYDKCFKHFIQWLRRTEKVNTYVWKCEIQRRGQIHYHITSPSWIHYQRIRDKWNNLQRQAGFIDEFKLKYGHDDPNSTDIHEVKAVKNLSGYLLKEFCKTIQNPDTTGKVWDCSQNLKAYKYYTVIENDLNSQLINQIITSSQDRIKNMDYCFIVNTKKLSQEQYLTLRQMKGYDDFLQMIRTYRKKE